MISSGHLQTGQELSNISEILGLANPGMFCEKDQESSLHPACSGDLVTSELYPLSLDQFLYLLRDLGIQLLCVTVRISWFKLKIKITKLEGYVIQMNSPSH